TRGQRCWVHKTANMLNKLPKSQQSKAKRALKEIWMAESKKDALAGVTAPCAQRDVSRTRPHLAIIFKLAEAAERSWRRFDGHNQVPKIILGVRFADGIEVVRQVQAAAA